MVRNEENGILQKQTAQCEMFLFHARTIMGGSHNFELAHLNKEKEEKHNSLAVCQLSDSVLFLLLGVLTVMKTLPD